MQWAITDSLYGWKHCKGCGDCKWQQTIKQIAKGAGILETMCQQMLPEYLKMQQVCQYIFPCMLTEDQMTIWMEMVGNLISATDKNPQFRRRIIMGQRLLPVSWADTWISGLSVFKHKRNEKGTAAKNGFQKSFDKLYTHWKKCVAEGEPYSEGGYASAL